MGLFFKNPKPPVTVIIKQGWFAVLIGGLIKLLILIVSGVIGGIGLIARPILGYLFTFQGRTQQQVIQQMTIFVFLVGVPFYLLYQNVPLFRDWISLSNTHTINYSKYGSRISHPDRSYFIVEGRRREIKGEEYGNMTYITYTGYEKSNEKAFVQKTDSNECPLIPRAQSLGLASRSPPTNAEGFKDEVEYTILIHVAELESFRYVWYLIKNPDLILKKKEELSVTQIEYKTSSTWERFIEDWPKIWSFPDGYKPFEVKALAREHGVICF